MVVVKNLVFVFCLLLSCCLKGQSNYLFRLSADEEIEKLLDKQPSDQKIDSLAIWQRMAGYKNQLCRAGYLQSSGRLTFSDSTATLHVDAGPRIVFKALQIMLTDSLYITEPELVLNDGVFQNPEGLANFQEQLAAYLEENGYPFAQSELKELKLQEDTLEAVLHVDPGPYITIDSLVIKGYTKFSPNVLRYFLNFKKGMPYRESYIKELPELIGQVEYLGFTAAPALAFTEEKSTLFLYMKEEKSNQVDGVIGLNTTPEGETTLNGEFQLRLLNVFKTGEEIKLRWRSPDESVQSLNAGLVLPFVFKTPFWLAGSFNIFRQDSSFVNTDAEGLVKYYLGGGSLVSGGIGYKASNTLQNTLSGFGNFTTTQYKLGLELFKTDRVLIPRRGYQINAFGFTASRDNRETVSTQYGWQLLLSKYSLFAKRHVFLTRLNSESLFGEGLFTNELYRIGGLKSLRGFNEQQIFTSSYAIATLEYRYMLNSFDYITAFSDVAFAENTANNLYSSNVYMGIGAGLSFRTNAGIFSLFYALGRDRQNGFDFRTSKIHFGYISRF